MIRKLVLAGSALLSLTGGAFAADLPARSAPPVYVAPAPVFTWTGIYVGGNVGYGGDNFNYPFSIGPIAGGASLTSSGLIGGGQVGFNYAFGGGGFGLGTAIVIGAEGDFQGSTISGRLSLNAGNALSASAGSRFDYLGTARGRIGVAFDKLLVYGTGGYAYARTTSSFSAGAVGLGALDVSKGTSHDGYAVGGGFEYAITPNFTLKTEYLRVELSTKNLLSTTVLGVPVSLSERPELNIVRAGFNYKFDVLAPAPVVARY